MKWRKKKVSNDIDGNSLDENEGKKQKKKRTVSSIFHRKICYHKDNQSFKIEKSVKNFS